MFVWTCYSFSLTTNSVSFSPFFDGENRKRVQISRSFFPTCFQSVKHAINKSPTQEIVLKNRGGREENFCLIPLCLGRVIKTLPPQSNKKRRKIRRSYTTRVFHFWELTDQSDWKSLAPHLWRLSIQSPIKSHWPFYNVRQRKRNSSAHAASTRLNLLSKHCRVLYMSDTSQSLDLIRSIVQF